MENESAAPAARAPMSAARPPSLRDHEATARLVAGVAHDANNMLAVMLINLELIRDGARETTLALATDALRAGAHAVQLVSRLVDVARGDRLVPRVVELDTELVSLETLFRRVLPPDIIVRVSSGTALWRVTVDPTALESAILNLVLNAKDAMRGGGVLEIGAANARIDHVEAAGLGLPGAGEYVVLTVADSGPGMAPEMTRRAFEPFFTTKPDGQGTGLGLPMVAEFARAAGGTARLDSEPGTGTTVRLYLPRASPSVAVQAPAPRPMPAAEAAHGKILLVEDNDLVRAHTDMLLRALGYEVTAAADGPSAINALRDGMRPDLLFTDVLLPGAMSGADVAAAAAAIVPTLRVLFTSGYVGDVLLRDGRLPPGVALLTKPFRRAELAERVRAQLQAPPWAGLDHH